MPITTCIHSVTLEKSNCYQSLVTTCSQSVTLEMLSLVVTTRYHLHPLASTHFTEKCNRYQSLPHVASLLHKKCTFVTTRYHLHRDPLCFIEKSNHYPSLPYVTSLLNKKFARYHLLPLALTLFPLEFCFRKKSSC